MRSGWPAPSAAATLATWLGFRQHGQHQDQVQLAPGTNYSLVCFLMQSDGNW